MLKSHEPEKHPPKVYKFVVILRQILDVNRTISAVRVEVGEGCDVIIGALVFEGSLLPVVVGWRNP